jgi:uncharacterized protein (TIGR03067 family)
MNLTPRYRFIGLAAAFITTAAFGSQAGGDTKLLDGAWLPSTAELGGDPLPDAVLKTMKLVITGDKYTVTVGKGIDRGSLKFDPAAKPKTMDIMGAAGPNKDKTFLAIYEIKDDTLRICYDLTGKARPREFQSKKGELVFLVTYRRAKD